MRREWMVAVTLLLVAGTAPGVFAQLPSGWTSTNIGSPAPTPAGTVQYDKATDTWTIRGSGTGLRGTSDQFYYVYRGLTGDGELAIRVASIDPLLADWSMAGVMIRVMLTPGSPYIFMGVTANTDGLNHGVTVWGRTAFDAPAEGESAGAMSAPYWVRVKRAGDTFSAYSSPDGKTWTENNSTAAPGMPKTIYIGYAVASEVAGQAITVLLDNGPTKATEPDPADGARNVLAPLVRWTPGVTAALHDVYFGTNATLGPADYKGRQSLTPAAYFHSSGLEPGATYYWRIDEVAADNKTVYTGDVWHFTAAPATAYAPQPWNGLDGVSVDADLAWSPGMGALSHDVYFGKDKAAVAAGDPAVFKGNQTPWTYNPGPLAADTTYYWRVDERGPNDVVHPGLLWSFTTIGPGIGVQARYFKGIDATGVPVLTQVENSIDHPWGGAEIAAGLSDNVSAVWTADLEAPFTETYQLITTSDDGVRLWLDGRRLIDVWTNHGGRDDVATVNLIAGQFYRVEMDWYENTGSAVAQLAWESPSIARQIIPAGPLQLPLRATDPYPANTAVNATSIPVLHWTAGERATGHDVYLGDSAEAVANADTATAGIYQGRQQDAEFDPGSLEGNKTYYWRVDEVNEANARSPWTGAVWTFTTADFLVVDDFESYTDILGSSIFDTWLDDWDIIITGGGGIIVGYADAPFAEQTIVHSGGQSMPLDYNNVPTPHYSETERTFDPVQDWTVNGVDTLVLYVRGKVGNVAAPLYVALEDSASKSATVTHPDAAIANAATWTEWKIPLSQFAPVNPAKIKKMYIGLGDKAHPTAGGHGQIFVDDIRVIKP
jgi:hypothetical protein